MTNTFKRALTGSTLLAFLALAAPAPAAAQAPASLIGTAVKPQLAVAAAAMPATLAPQRGAGSGSVSRGGGSVSTGGASRGGISSGGQSRGGSVSRGGGISAGGQSRGGSVSRGGGISNGGQSRGGSVSVGGQSRGGSISTGGAARGGSVSRGGGISTGGSAGTVTRGATPSGGSISRGAGTARGATTTYGGTTRSAPTGSTRGATGSSTPSAGTRFLTPGARTGPTRTDATPGTRSVPGTTGTAGTAARTPLTTRYDAARRGGDAVTLDRPSSGGTASPTGATGTGSSGVIDLTSSARQPRVRFPKLTSSPDARPTRTPTTTPTTPERARVVRTDLIRDQVSGGSILDRYKGPAGRRLSPGTGNAADRATGPGARPVAPTETGSSSRGDLGRRGARTDAERPSSPTRTRGSSSERGSTPTATPSQIDVSRGRGLTAAGRVENGRLSARSARSAPAGRDLGPRDGGSPRTRSNGAGNGGSRSARTAGGSGSVDRGPQLKGLERVRAEDPQAAERLRKQNDAARRLSDVALNTTLTATSGLIGHSGGFGIGVGIGGGGGGYGGGYGYGGYGYGCGSSGQTSWAFGIGLSSFWWSAGYCYPGFSWYYPYYRSNCYWYGYPSYGWSSYAYCWPSYYYTPVYSTYPVYYESAPSVVVVNGGSNPVEYVEGEVALANDETVTAPSAAAEPSNPGRTEELARAASQYLKLGDTAFREGRFGDAVHFYAKAVEYAPDEGVLFLILSDALFATGDYHYAAYAIRKAAELEPTLFAAPVDKHSFYGDPAAFDRQLAVLELYLADHYLDDDARLVLATNYLFGDRPAAAADLLDHPFSEGLRGDGAGAVVLESAKALQYGGR